MTRWRPVRNYEGLYSVSNTGRVKSRERTVPHRNIMMRIREKELTPWYTNGYPMVMLSKNGIETKHAVHVLVCTAFHGPRPHKGMEVRHFPDRDKCNNHESNLRWGTVKQNAKDRIRHGTTTKGQSYFDGPQGETHPFAKLTTKQIKVIRRHLKNPYRGLGRQLARQYGVTEATICDIKMGRTRRRG